MSQVLLQFAIQTVPLDNEIQKITLLARQNYIKASPSLSALGGAEVPKKAKASSLNTANMKYLSRK